MRFESHLRCCPICIQTQSRPLPGSGITATACKGAQWQHRQQQQRKAPIKSHKVVIPRVESTFAVSRTPAMIIFQSAKKEIFAQYTCRASRPLHLPHQFALHGSCVLFFSRRRVSRCGNCSGALASSGSHKFHTAGCLTTTMMICKHGIICRPLGITTAQPDEEDDSRIPNHAL